MKIFMRICIGCLLVTTQAAMSAEKDALVYPDAEWHKATPDNQGIDSQKMHRALRAFHQQSGGVGSDEMVIIRNGRLIWEGPNADNVHEIYSCTKTFTSTVMGLLVTSNHIFEDDYAVQYLPTLDDNFHDYNKITLHQLATMTAGYAGIMGSGWEFYNTDRALHYRYVQTYTMPGSPDFEAGSTMRYRDPQVHLLGYILTKVAGNSLENIFTNRVAYRIGMKHFKWTNYGYRDGMFFNNPAGTPDDGQGGVHSSARDLARYGLLYLSGGEWNGEKILAPAFVHRATSNQVPADLDPDYFLCGRYGYYWWTNDVRADGARPMPSAPPGTYLAHGAGRNFIIIVPEWNMVIVRLSPAPGGDISVGQCSEQILNTFLAQLGESIQQ